MSRIIVKNLPKKISQSKLQDLFSTKGCITDLQLKYTKNGKFRQFAFVGYKTDEEAGAAKEYFDGTFVDASKIHVEICANLGDTNKPRAWSKHSKEKQVIDATEPVINEAENQKVKSKKKKKKNEKDSDDIDKKSQSFPEELLQDSKFQEFLEVNKVRSKKPVWGDDGINPENDETAVSEDEVSDQETEETPNLARNKALSDKDYLKSKMLPLPDAGNEESAEKDAKETKSRDKIQKEKMLDDTFTVKLRNLPYNCKKKQILQFFLPLKPESLRIPPKIKGFAYVKFGTDKEMKQALNKHKGFFEGRRVHVVKYEKKTSHQEDKKPEDDAIRKLEEQELLAETGRLFVRNLNFDVKQEELETLFSKYGQLAEIHIPIDPYTKKSLGYGFVSFIFAEHAIKAFAQLDGTIFQGRLLHLIPAKPKKEAPTDLENSSFKKKKAAKLKALSGNSYNWNALFLGLNTVADAISKRYNIEKSTLLNEENEESLPVRMALGETQLVMETRDFLLKNKVELDSFSQPAAERSKTVIIVKNLPAGTQASEIHEVFTKHGLISRVVLPPSGVTALVEFQEPTEAKIAFKRLSYSRFGHCPLYLEWAPMNVFREGAETTPEESIDSENKELNSKDVADATKTKDREKEEEEQEDESAPELGATLFVKNLNFSTTEKELKRHFKSYEPLYMVSISKKKDLHSGDTLSMGFGFIQFHTKSSASQALRDLQNSELGGHNIELKFSNRATLLKPETSRKMATTQQQKSSKILVRNIPFEVTEKEVRDLFKEFGGLKSVRLPKKASDEGTHRGFGFVDFVSKSNAKRAFNTLCHSTHLLGRRLVLEWANPEMDDIPELRKKTAREFYTGGPAKKLTKSKLAQDVALASAKRHGDEEMSD